MLESSKFLCFSINVLKTWNKQFPIFGITKDELSKLEWVKSSSILKHVLNHEQHSFFLHCLKLGYKPQIV